jgi:hypothetical protein
VISRFHEGDTAGSGKGRSYDGIFVYKVLL